MFNKIVTSLTLGIFCSVIFFGIFALKANINPKSDFYWLIVELISLTIFMVVSSISYFQLPSGTK